MDPEVEMEAQFLDLEEEMDHEEIPEARDPEVEMEL